MDELGWLEAIRFHKDVAVVCAQVAAVLIVAFLVEVRAIGARRAIEGRDLRWVLVLSFSVFALLIAGCFVAINGPDVLHGNEALTMWVWVGALLIGLAFFVALAGWAAIEVASADAKSDRDRKKRIDRHLSTPGWVWFFRGRRR